MEGDDQLCQCGHPKRADRGGQRGQGHANGIGRCLACLRCETEGVGPHLPARCGCGWFTPVKRVTRAQAVTQGGVPCRCGEHYATSHGPDGRCRVRVGGIPCPCPGFDPDPRYLKEN